MLRDEWECSGVLFCAEVRGGSLHPVSYELAGKARELADKKKTLASAVVFCESLKDDPDELISRGADRVVLVRDGALGRFNQEISSNLLAYLIDLYRPEIVLAPATTSGRSYLPAVAALMRTGLTADCTDIGIEMESGLLIQTRPAIGGNIIASIKTPKHVPQMATVRPRTFRVPDRVKRDGMVVTPEIPARIFESRIETFDMEYASASDGSDIQDKEVIIAGGKGLRRPENFELLRELARMLDGGVGASRPTVEEKWISFPHQVGLSGKVVSPKLYIAAGISGAVQHLAGMQTAQKIVAVNKDPDAPIFRVADIALCGDVMDIIPRLIERIGEEVKR